MIVALAAGAAVVLVAVSVAGRQSGAHLNPALTFGLWLQRTVSPADLAGYGAAQLARPEASQRNSVTPPKRADVTRFRRPRR